MSGQDRFAPSRGGQPQPPQPFPGPQPPPEHRPLYARVLRLRHIRLSSLVSFLLLEGMLAVGVLLALTEMVSWWAVPVLPVAVAVMVKLNDTVAGAFASDRDSAGDRPVTHPPEATAAAIPVQPPLRATRQVSREITDTLDPVNSPRQRFRQSARRRYR